jgi:hypothetical protein
MLNNKNLLYLSLFASFLFSACSSTQKVDKEALSRIKKAAIVGFTMDQEEAASGKTIFDQVMGRNDTGDYGKIGVEIKESQHASMAYDIALKTLSTRLGMEFVPRSKVVENPMVQAFYEYKNKTFQPARQVLNSMHYRYEAKGVPQFYYLHNSKKEELNQLAKSLGVDALVMVNSTTELVQTALLGMSLGTPESRATISLYIYDPKTSDYPVLLIARGDKISTKDKIFLGFADQNSMNIQSLMTMEKAFIQATEKL